ncbi:MAG: dTDP-4-dehydrorhamnose reductase [Prochlorococcus marinus CUG1439]|uniref:dTDP-4-dehydrorhamnose reductase n=1 Tax=Prochlorococcus sp. MIT 1314 TaxID=3096220 RepID=UPI001B09865A|nr:dTDP-4-dehydrorhamnose reductase [Prochlorococcus sp. MIT 1314]MCR8538781.1 dTDP-4-dehydrorhamnose reductase [Prochlorococcus marinus CUG1439]
MKVLITGSKGQLGRALIKLKPKNIKIYAMERTNFDMLDIPSCLKVIKSIKPDWIINCGAYTNVDLAESQEEAAMNVNFHAPKAFAQEIKKLGGRFLQISTDYVFSGLNRNKPYSTSEKRSPLGIYGLSKANAEEAIENIFEGTNQGIILRTSWLMGPFGNNFLLTILNLHLKKKEIKVVNDQIGSPTSVFSLAEVCWKIIKIKDYSIIKNKTKNGILHWHDDGEASWYEVAKIISNVGQKIGLINNRTEIIPIKTSDFTSSAKRPFYSVLECNSTKSLLNHENMNWKYELERNLEQIYLNKSNRYSFNPKHK